MFSNEEIKRICNNFNIECFEIGHLIDTSKAEDDKRFNYQINDKYFLKITNFKGITESFLRDIVGLIENYKSIDVYCPSLYRTNNNTLSVNIEKSGANYTCYLEEKSPFPVKEYHDEVDYNLKKQVLDHVGRLATNFTNHNLSQIRSMWSIIELSPYDTDIDEKQENFEALIKCLEDKGFSDLVCKLIAQNDTSRRKIKNYMTRLPKCVYQGDLNDSNILINETGKFQGLIDYNMFGTEINVNYFLNESMYYLTNNDFEELSACEIFSKMNNMQNELLSVITSHYELNNDELEIIDDYKQVIFTSFYPNVALMINLLQKDNHRGKVVEFLDII